MVYVAIIEIAITLWGAIQKRCHEPISKTDRKNEAKKLRATTFAIANFNQIWGLYV